METLHDGCLNETNRAINIVILYSWDENLFALFEQVLLDSANMLDIADILVKFRIDSHMLGSDCKSLSMLVLILNIEHKGDTSWIFCHHLLYKAHSKVDTFHNERLIALVKRVYYFRKLLRYE